MSLADVFNTDAFTLTSLTQAVNKLPFVPSRIGQLGIFGTRGVNTRTVVIEEKAGTLSLLPTRPRGGPASIGKSPKRTARSFLVPHIPHDDTVLADDVQNVRAFGSEDALQGAIQVVNDKLTAMRQDFEVTFEHLRAGALSGSILDADGSTELFNLFTEFGVSETDVDFVLGTAGTDIRDKILTVIDTIETELGAAPFQHIHCLAEKTWFRDFISHAEVKAAYDRFREGEFLRSDPRAGFQFAGVTFEEYRGKIGSTDFITADTARFFPVGVPGLFTEYYAPADFMETVNTVGIPFYAKQRALDHNRGIEIHTQSNPLPLCHRPALLVLGSTSN